MNEKLIGQETLLENLYNATSSTIDIGTLESFTNNIKDSTKRRNFYDAASPYFELGSFEDFDKRVSNAIPPTKTEGFIEDVKEGAANIGESILEEGLVGTALDVLPEEIEEKLSQPLIPLRSLFPEEPPEMFSEGSLRSLFNVGKGVAAFAEGLTSPINLALLFTGSGAIKVAGWAIPAIFSADMALQLPNLWKDITEAIERGDTDEATELITIGTLTAGTVGVLGKETLKRIGKRQNVVAPEAEPYIERNKAALAEPEKAAALEKSMKDLEKIAAEIKINEATESVARAKNGEFTRTAVIEESPKRALTAEDIRISRATDIAEAFQALTPFEKRLRRQKQLERTFKDVPIDYKFAEVKKGNRPVKEVYEELASIGKTDLLSLLEKKERSKPLTPADLETGLNIKGKPKLLESPKTKKGISKSKVKTKRKTKSTRQKPTFTKAVDKNTRQNFNKALGFLEEKYPRLMSTLTDLRVFGSKEYNVIFPDARPFENGTFEFFKTSKGDIQTRITLKGDHVFRRPKTEKSPQKTSITAEEKAGEPIIEIKPSVEAFIETISHEFAHNRDLAAFGVNKFLAMQELGFSTESLKGNIIKAKGKTTPREIFKGKIDKALKHVEEGQPKPQRYMAQLAERRARAQSRTALRSFETIQQKLGEAKDRIETRFNQPAYERIRPFIESAWRDAERIGKSWPEFASEAGTILGKNGKPYLEKFRGELDVSGGLDRSKGKVSPPEGERNPVPEPSSKGDANLDVKMKELTEYQSALKQYANKWTQKVVDILSIENRFYRLDGIETAFAVKNFPGFEKVINERFLKGAENIAHNASKHILQKPDSGFLHDIVLMSERGKVKGTIEHLQAVKEFKRLFKESEKFLGEFNETFTPKRNVKRAINSQLTKLSKAGENTRLVEVGSKSASNIQSYSLEGSLLLDHLIRQDPIGASQILFDLAKRNKTGTVKNILDSGLIQTSEINMIDLVGTLGRRIGQDYAILKVREAGLKEGFIRKAKEPPIEKGGAIWAKAPEHSSFLQGYIIRTPLKEWLYRMTKSENRGMQIIDRAITSVKMAAFANPAFLPMYDIYQAGMAGVLKPHLTGAVIGGAVGGIPGASLGFLAGEAASRTLTRGFVHAFNKTERYFEANMNGMSSVPFPESLKSYRESINNIKLSAADPNRPMLSAMAEGIGLVKDTFRVGEYKEAFLNKDGVKALKLTTGLFPRSIKNMYNISTGVAWALDRGVRMATYEYFRGKGFSPREAAQMSARIHGDYAGVPIETRKIANRFLFTPTFKIAMAKVQIEMVKSAIKGVTAPTDVIRGIIGKSSSAKKLTPRQAQMAAGLFYIGTILYGYHQFMISQGFEMEEFSTKYKRRTVTDEGIKDVVVSHSSPANLYIKYWQRVRGSFDAGPQPALKSLANRFKWEITPLWRIASQMIQNRDSNGEPIILTTDSTSDKMFKNLKFGMVNIYQMLKTFSPDEEQIKAQESLAAETGQIFQMALRPFTFTYLKDPKSSIGMSKINQVTNQFQQDIREGRIPREDIDAHMKRQLEIINDLMERYFNKED